MGIEHRDYYRNSSRGVHRPSNFADMPIVCKRLLIALVVVFLAQIFFLRAPTIQDLSALPENLDQQVDPEFPEMTTEQMQRVSVVQEWCKLDPVKIAHAQVWRLVTYAFLHDRYSIWHLLFNALFLYWFGTRLEQIYGSTEFALFYFASAIVAGIAFLGLDYYTGSTASATGANGAVWGLLALYVILHPYERVNICGIVPVEIRWLALIYLVLDLHPVLLALSGEPGLFDRGVAHSAHLGGAAFGFLYYQRSWRLTPIYNRVISTFRGSQAPTDRRTGRSGAASGRGTIPFPRPDFDTDARQRPRDKRLEADLDAVLEKIQTEGRDSLTSKEVDTLARASEQYRNRS